MNSSTRFALWALIVATAVCAALAVFVPSELFAIVAAACATFATTVAFAAPERAQVAHASAIHVGYDPTTSATVDVLDLPKPVVFESTDVRTEPLARPAQDAPPSPTPEAAPAIALQATSATPSTTPEPPEPAPLPAPAASASQPAPPAIGPDAPHGVADAAVSAYEPADRFADLPFVHRAYAFTPRLPVGTEPRDVVRSLLLEARAAGDVVSAHLWLEDPATETLRLVEAQGSVRPDHVPVNAASGVLGSALSEGSARLGTLEPSAPGLPHDSRWRYALPLTGSGPCGVAAVDFSGEAEPDRALLTAMSAALRASLAGALALHVARTEADAARALVDACAHVSHCLDPHDALRTALERAMSLADAQTGSIMLMDPTTRRMRIAVARGLPDDIVAATDISEGDGIAGWVLASGQPLVVEDLKGAGIRSRRHGIRSAVCVPLADDEGTLGVLNVGCVSFHARLSRNHLQTLQALGRSVVVALRSAWSADGAQDLYFDTLKALALALEARDPYARGGTDRIVSLADSMAEHFELSRTDTHALRIAAMLHDLGMSAAGTVVPITDGPLSTVEWGMLKMHPVIAAEIMSQAPALSAVVPLVYHHHEHYDGSGYVAGLSGSHIPLGARILAVLDAYVAMIAGRPYRAALTHAEAIRELARLSGTQFDPLVVHALIEVTSARQGGDAPN